MSEKTDMGFLERKGILAMEQACITVVAITCRKYGQLQGLTLSIYDEFDRVSETSPQSNSHVAPGS